MVLFLLKFILTNLVFGFALSACLRKWFPTIGKSERIVYSLGLGPAVTSLLLYYLLIVIPAQSDVVYFTLIIILFLGILIRNRSILKSEFKDWTQQCLKLLSSWNMRFSKNTIKDTVLLKNDVLAKRSLSALVFLYLAITLYTTALKPVFGHDILEYLVQSDIFYLTKEIHFDAHRFDSGSGYYYVGLHGFSYPLLGLWESITDGVFGSNYYDHYFKFQTGYYAILLILLMYTWLRKMDARMAAGAVIALTMSYGFFLLSYNFHLDTYRIFFFSLAFIFTVRYISEKEPTYLILLGIFSGLSAFTHSLGVFMFVFSCIVLVLMTDWLEWIKRFKAVAIVVVIMLLFGGIHYLFDIGFGTGWIFKNIKFY